MTNTNYAMCPRCSDPFEVRYPAMSRATSQRDVEICKWCGSDEAVGRGVFPVADWPIGANRMIPITESMTAIYEI